MRKHIISPGQSRSFEIVLGCGVFQDRQGVLVRVQMHSQTFDKHAVYLIMVKDIKHDKETLVCELSDDIKHIHMHWDFTKIRARKNERRFEH